MDPRNYFQDSEFEKYACHLTKKNNACQNILIFGARIKYVRKSVSVRTSALSFCSFYYEMLEKFVKKKNCFVKKDV